MDRDQSTFFDAALATLWRERARTYGARCAINLAHPARSYDSIGKQQQDILYPALQRLLTGHEKTVLDFGCGPGRFTPGLASLLHGDAIGFDICQELLDLAPPAPNVRYTSSEPELSSRRFDVIWICLVLGGIPDPKCAVVAARLMTRLNKGGLLFLVEHASGRDSGSKIWTFRSVADYQRMFPALELSKVGHYHDFKNEVSILGGRQS